MTLARVGSDMVVGLVVEAAEADGDGGGLGFGAAAVEGWVERVGEDRRDRDTRLSRSSKPRLAAPRLRSS